VTVAAAPTVVAARAALKEVEATAAALNVFSTDYEGKYELPFVGERRRRLRAGLPDPVATMALVLNDEGVLLWRAGAQSAELAGRQLRRGATPVPDGDLVELYQYEKLEPNEVNQFLIDLDKRLNPAAGLRRFELTPGTATVVARPLPEALAGSKRRLLFIHGTFSKSEAFAHGIEQAANGSEFLRRVFAHYDEVLAFDHPTLSVSPMLNAFDLFGLMAKAAGPLDIVAHSRGGLVARWYLEGFSAALGPGPYRAVLVGSPLGGTSLASPRRLHDALSLLSNVGTALKAAGSGAVAYFPLLAAPLALLKVATSVVSVAAKTPVLDAAVAMIPGLSGQSRIENSQELDRLRRLTFARPPAYYVVQSNFETEDVGWRFWKWFRADKLKDVAADHIFPGPNDLVVDTLSMSQFAMSPTLPQAQGHDFGTTGQVHHTNYFEQRETLDCILDKLGVP
jgi:hypothetical protein